MRLPTKRVRMKSTGEEYTINASDFDPKLHAEIGAPLPARASIPPSAEPAPEPTSHESFDETPGSIATVNVPIALDLIAQADSAEALAELERAEKASVKQKGGRKTVLEAIKDRRALLGKG